jgi:hypothetical protein
MSSSNLLPKEVHPSITRNGPTLTGEIKWSEGIKYSQVRVGDCNNSYLQWMPQYNTTQPDKTQVTQSVREKRCRDMYGSLEDSPSPKRSKGIKSKNGTSIVPKTLSFGASNFTVKEQSLSNEPLQTKFVKLNQKTLSFDEQPPRLPSIGENEYECGTCIEVQTETPCPVCSEEVPSFKPFPLTRQGGVMLSDEATKEFHRTGKLPLSTLTVPTTAIGGGVSLGTEPFPSKPLEEHTVDNSVFSLQFSVSQIYRELLSKNL